MRGLRRERADRGADALWLDAREVLERKELGRRGIRSAVPRQADVSQLVLESRLPDHEQLIGVRRQVGQDVVLRGQSAQCSNISPHLDEGRCRRTRAEDLLDRDEVEAESLKLLQVLLPRVHGIVGAEHETVPVKSASIGAAAPEVFAQDEQRVASAGLEFVALPDDAVCVLQLPHAQGPPYRSPASRRRARDHRSPTAGRGRSSRHGPRLVADAAMPPWPRQNQRRRPELASEMPTRSRGDASTRRRGLRARAETQEVST